MKILHVIPSMNPSTGGPPRIALRLAAGAALLGHNVTLLAHDYPQAKQEIEADWKAVPGGSQVHPLVLPPLTWKENWLAWRDRRELASIIPRFDVIHTHSIWNGISRVAMEIAGRRGVPYAVLVNGMLDPWSMSQRGWKKRLALAMGMRRRLNGAAFLQAGNTDERDALLALGLTAPIQVIPNGIYPQEFDALPPQGRFRAAHPELGESPFVLFMSRLHWQKGVDVLRAAFEQLARRRADVHLVVAGPDGGELPALLQWRDQQRLGDRVHVVGALYGPQRFEAMVDAACFCLPSRQEGFSMAVLEALACAAPVVISTGCHFPLVAERGAGAVVPVDASATAEALAKMLGDPDAARRAGQEGRRLVYEQLTWPDVARRVVEAYASAIGDSHPQHAA